MSNSEFFGWFGVIAVVGVAMVATLSSCDGNREVVTEMKVDTVNMDSGAGKCRFSVRKIGKFYDMSAYDNWRSIYVVTDSETGAEYVGVSGVGISELGSHRNGKTNHEDER
jgi:hypothetical protein